MTYKFSVSIRLFITCLCFAVTGVAKAQLTDSTSYPIVIQFNSECCGVPSDKPLRNCISKFRKKYKIKNITALHFGPMGREGEYWLAFSLDELTGKQAAIFINQIKAATEKLKNPGMAMFVKSMVIANSNLPLRGTVEKVKF